MAENHTSGIPAPYIPTRIGDHAQETLSPKREIFLHVWAYGIPIDIGFLGLFLGWWEKLANAT